MKASLKSFRTAALLGGCVAAGWMGALRAETDPVGGHAMLPDVSILSPINGSASSSPVSIVVSATPSANGNTIAQVGFLVDGGLWAMQSHPPYSYQAFVGPGIHTFLARAYVPSGDFANSYLVNVAVGQNFPPPPSPDPWQTEPLAQGSAKMPSLAIDRNDVPHAAYILNNQLFYAKWNGSGWQTENLLNDASRVSKISLAVDPDGNPAVGYVWLGPYSNALYLAKKSGGLWTTATLSTAAVNAVSVAVDAARQVKVAFTDNGSSASELRYASETGGAWTNVLVDSHGWVFDNPSLAFDPSNNPRIAYTVLNHHETNSTELRFAAWNGYWGSFHVIEAIPSGAASRVSLALDRSGAPGIALVSGDRNLAYAIPYDNGNANNWAMELVESSVTAGAASLAFTSAGEPVLAYISGSTLKLARRSSRFWYKQGIAPTTGVATSLKLGSNDSPFLLYESPGENAIRSAKISGSSPTDLLISGIATREVGISSATIQWTTNRAADSRVEYGTRTYSDGPFVYDGAQATSHRVSLTNLDPNTLYHFRVASQDSFANRSASGEITFRTAVPPDTTPPSIAVLSPSSGSALAGTVLIQGTASDDDRVAQVEVQVDSGPFNLAPGSAAWSYSFDSRPLSNGPHAATVRATDPSGNSRTVSIGWIAANPPPAVSSVSVQGISMTSARVLWATDEPSDSQVEYGPTDGYGFQTGVDPNLVSSSHSVLLSGLRDGELYHFRAKSKDAYGRVGVSSDSTLTTLPVPDTAPPRVAILAPSSGSVLSGNAVLSGTAWDGAGLLKVELRVDSGTLLLATGLSSWTFTLDTQLLADGAHRLTARASDGSGNFGEDGVAVTVDNRPPVPNMTISNVSFSAITPNSARVAWTTSRGGDSLVDYGPTADYGSISSSSGTFLAHWVLLEGLAPNTSYHFRVRSAEPGGSSAASEDSLFMTAKKNVSHLTLVQGSIILSWDYDQDGAFSEFVVYKSTWCYPLLGGALLYQGSASRYEDFDVEPGKRYFYAVNARNRSGGWAGDAACISAVVLSKDKIGSMWKMVSSQSGDTLDFFNTFTLTIPPQVLPGDTEISLNEMDPHSSGSDLSQLSKMGRMPVGSFMELGPDGFHFSAPLTLVFNYDPAQIPAGTERDLQVATWNGAGGNWEVLPSAVDPVSRRVTVQTTHFSLYGLLARTATAYQLEQVYAYPNPAILSPQVNFYAEAGAADEVVLRIYNDAGEKVWEAPLAPRVLDGKTVFEYSLRTEALPSGTYLYTVRAKKQGFTDLLYKDKFAIIK